MSRTLSGPESQAQGHRITKAKADWMEYLEDGTACTTGEIRESLLDEFKFSGVLANKILTELRAKFPHITEGDAPVEEDASVQFQPASLPDGAIGAFDTRESDFLPDPEHEGYVIGNRCGMMAVAGKGRSIGKMLAMYRQWRPATRHQRPRFVMGYRVTIGKKRKFIPIYQVGINRAKAERIAAKEKSRLATPV